MSIPNFNLNVGTIETSSSSSGAVRINVDPHAPKHDIVTELSASRSIDGSIRDEPHITLLMREALRFVVMNSMQANSVSYIFLQSYTSNRRIK